MSAESQKKQLDIVHKANSLVFGPIVERFMKEMGKHPVLVRLLPLGVGAVATGHVVVEHLISDAHASGADLHTFGGAEATPDTDLCPDNIPIETVIASLRDCEEGGRRLLLTMVHNLVDRGENLQNLDPHHPVRLLADSITGVSNISERQALQEAMRVMRMEVVNENGQVLSYTIQPQDHFNMDESGHLTITRSLANGQLETVSFFDCDGNGYIGDDHRLTGECPECVPTTTGSGDVQNQNGSETQNLETAPPLITEVQHKKLTMPIAFCEDGCYGEGHYVTRVTRIMLIEVPITLIPENIINDPHALLEYLGSERDEVSMEGFDDVLYRVISPDGTQIGPILCDDDSVRGRHVLNIFDTDSQIPGRQGVFDSEGNDYTRGILDGDGEDMVQQGVEIKLAPSGRFDEHGRPILDTDLSVTLNELTREQYFLVWRDVVSNLGVSAEEAAQHSETWARNIVLNENLPTNEVDLRAYIESAMREVDSTNNLGSLSNNAYETASRDLAGWIIKYRTGVSEYSPNQMPAAEPNINPGETLYEFLARGARGYSRIRNPLSQ